MRNNRIRIKLALRRANRRLQYRQDFWILALSMMGCVMFALEIGLLTHIGQRGDYQSPEGWMYGATLLPSNVGGYILVAVVAFVIAVAVTVLCIKQHEKMKQEEE